MIYMTGKRNFLKITSLILALAMIFSLASCTSSDDSEETTTEETSTAEQHDYDGTATNVTKAETVYVNLDAKGNKLSTVVSDKLHSDLSQVKLYDKSDLTNIVNVKGTEQPIIDGNDITWNIESNDLFYRGYTDKELPLEISAKYYFEGEEVEPEALAGKTGKVKIEITVKNTLYEEKEINGTTYKIYNPMLVVGGLILQEDKFNNITAQNGRFISDGSKTIVFFAGMPGVSDTLGIDSQTLQNIGISALSDINLGGVYTIEADATDCSLGNMYFAALPISGITKTFKLSDDIDSIADLLETLSELANALKNVDTDKIISALSADGDNLNQLTSALSDAAKLYEDNKVLVQTLSDFLTQDNIKLVQNVLNDLKGIDTSAISSLANDENLTKLLNDLAKTDLSKYESLLKNPLFKAFFSDISTLASDAETLIPTVEKLADALKNTDLEKLISDVQALMSVSDELSSKLSTEENQAALDKLPDTVKEVQNIVSIVENNSDLINSLMEFAGSDDIKKISSILENADTENIEKIAENLANTSLDAETAIALFKEMLSYGSENTVFSMAADGTETSLMFIFKTAAVNN